MTLQLLIVDDHSIMRSGLRRLLAAERQPEIAEAVGVSYKNVAKRTPAQSLGNNASF